MWQEAEAFLSQDKYLGLLIKKYGSCKIKKRGKEDYFEDLVEAIVSQQLSVKAASTIFGRLKERAREIRPENILKLRRPTLRALGLSNAKASYVKDLAQRVKEGKLEVGKLNDLTDEKIMEELVAVKGIGRWTAEMFLMFSLGRADIFPVDDLGIRNGLKKLLKRNLSPQKMEKFAFRWRPFRTVASWYLWKTLDDEV